jgi:hypothetical protein
MSKAIEGAALIGAVIGAEVLTAMFDPALTVNPAFQKAMFAIGMAGVSMEAGAIASALTSNRGMNITTRQAAAARQIIYGQQRVGGVQIFKSTTGSHKDQMNYAIVIAGHVCDSIVNLYLDGRQVHWAGGVGNTTRNGVNFGGAANGIATQARTVFSTTSAEKFTAKLASATSSKATSSVDSPPTILPGLPIFTETALGLVAAHMCI